MFPTMSSKGEHHKEHITTMHLSPLPLDYSFRDFVISLIYGCLRMDGRILEME